MRRLVLWRRLWPLGLLALCVSWCSLGAPASAEDAPRPLRDLVDEQIAAGWQSRNVAPAAPASDEEFLRRVHLDLAGVIPTSSAAKAFLDDPAADKRAKLVDQLLAGPEHARHMQHVFDVMLLERQYGNYITDKDWQDYLRTSFAENKPWDQMVRELVGSDGSDPKIRPAIRFFTVRTIDSYRVLSPTMITRDLGRLLLGVNLQCAQCHNHPVISDYKQADYFGIYAFVNRAHFVQAKLADKDVFMIGEKADGAVKFTSVFDAEKKEQTTHPRLPGGAEFVEPKFAAGEEYKVKPAAGVVPVPNFSPRGHLMAALTSPDNVAFRQNIANRLWQMMLGRGIVHPPDLHHSANPPSHPELLKLLGERLAADKFNMRNLLREIALSRTYQLSSAAPAGAALPPESFAVAPLRPMRPEQLAFAMLQATGMTDVERAALGANATEQAMYDKLAGNLKPFVELYGRPPGQAENGYDASLFQALFLANGGLLNSWLAPRPGNLVERCVKLAVPAQIAEELYLNVYSRRPTAEEAAAVAEFLAGRDQELAVAVQELAWGMIAAVEFRFVH